MTLRPEWPGLAEAGVVQRVAAHLRAHSCGARVAVFTDETYFLEAAAVAAEVIQPNSGASLEGCEISAFALEAADELELKGRIAKSVADSVPAIVKEERQEQHREIYEAEATRWFRLARAVRDCVATLAKDEERHA